MARANVLQEAFNAGELSPQMAARVDFAKYPAAGAKCQNIVPLAQGGWSRRPGSRYVNETKDSSAQARLLRFEFSTTQAYPIEAGNSYFRLFRNQGTITVLDTDAAIDNGTFTSNITDWDDRSTGGGSIAHDATNGRLNLIPGGATASDIGWAEQDVAVGASVDTNEHSLQFQVLGAPGNKVQLRVGTTSTGNEIVDDVEFEVGYHVYSFTPGDGNSTIYIQFRNLGTDHNKTLQIDNVVLLDNAPLEIVTPYATADLAALKIAQNADVMYIGHPDYPIYKLTRSGHTKWSLIEVLFDDGPYLNENTTTTTLVPSAASGLGINLTLSAVTGVNDNQGWLSTDIGRLVRYKKANNWGTAIITSITSTTVAVADVLHDFEATPTAVTTFRLGAWSGTTGYPATVFFFEQRFGAARTTQRAQSFWLSQSADLENMTPDNRDTANDGTVEDDDALDYTFAADQVNAILWCSPGKQLILGTSGGEWVVTSDGPVLTPTDVEVKRHTTHGSADIAPVRVGNAVLFLQKAQRKVREFAFNFENDAFAAPDLTILAEHVTRSKITEMAYAEEPGSVVWCVRTDGQLCSMTYRRNQDVVGWARHIIGGAFSGGDAVCESIAVIPGNDGAGQVQSSAERDEVWLIVKRTINSATVRSVEFFEGGFEGPIREDYETDAAWETAVLSAQQDAYFSDCLLTYDDVSTTTITGLTHLEGETVKVLADGAVHPDKTVSSGSITLEYAASKVQIGLGYTHKWKSLKLTAGAVAGTGAVQTKRIDAVGMVLLDAAACQLGPDETDLQNVTFREVADAMDTAVPLFTGEVPTADYVADWETDPRILIQSDNPAPFTMLALVPSVDTQDAL